MDNCMSEDELKEMLSAERDEIQKYKWIRSEQVGYDLGNTAVLDWIRTYADSFKRNWSKTKNKDK